MVATTGRSELIFLACGILAALLSLGTDVLAGSLWAGYDSVRIPALDDAADFGPRLCREETKPGEHHGWRTPHATAAPGTFRPKAGDRGVSGERELRAEASFWSRRAS